MTSTPSYVFGLIIFAFFLLFTVEVAGFTTNYIKASHATESIITNGKKYGVIEQEDVNEILLQQDLSPDYWNVSVTQNEEGIYNSINVEINGAYQMRSLYVFGRAVGDSIDSTIPINIHREVLGEIVRD